MYELRDYQKEILAILEKKLTRRPDGRYIVQLPTGMGKTVVFSALLRRLACPALVIAHRRELLLQARDKIAGFMDCAPEQIDIVQQSRPDATKRIWIASVQTLARGKRMQQIAPQILIIDEAHHSCAPTYRRIMDHYGKIPVIGFSATPTRRTPKEKKILAELWDEVVYQYPIRKAIRENWLAGIEYYRVESQTALDDVKIVHGDFQARALSQKVNTRARNHACVEKYRELGGGKAVVFCVDVAHAQDMAAAFETQGIESHCVVGQTDPQIRRETLMAFDQAPVRRHLVLTNCMVLSEGWDCPSVKMEIMARPTRSEIVYIQQLGRGLRPAPGKDKVIVVDIADHYGRGLCNCLHNVYQLDQNVLLEGDIEATLTQRQKRLFAGEVAVEEQELAKLSLQLTDILFSMPEAVAKHHLAWFAPTETEYYLDLGNKQYLKIEDHYLRYTLYWNHQKFHTGTNLREMLEIAAHLTKGYQDTRYIWDKSAREMMAHRRPTDKQLALLKEICPEIRRPELLTRESASRMISARLVQLGTEPATEKQKHYLKALGYKEDMSRLTKHAASELIDRLKLTQNPFDSIYHNLRQATDAHCEKS